MSEVITKVDGPANPGSISTTRTGDYTGILPSQKIKEMLGNNEIKALLRPIDDDQVQPASIDLRLGDCAYPVDTSFLPGKGMRVLEKMKQLDDKFDGFKIDLRNGAVLEKGQIYVIPLLEAINLRSEVAAFANPSWLKLGVPIFKARPSSLTAINESPDGPPGGTNEISAMRSMSRERA